MEFKILNSKEIKKLLNNIEKQYKTKKLSLDCAFLMGKEGRVYVLSRDFKDLDTDRLKINRLGLYFCRIQNNDIRLSVEGSQIIGKVSEKIVDLNDDEIIKWISGEDIEKESKEEGYFIVRYKDDFYGTTKIKNNLLKNFIPKNRRIKKKLRID